MKYCPQCNRQYSEAWLTFCTNDGSLLKEDLSPPADPNFDPRIRETKVDDSRVNETRFDDPSEHTTQWLPRDRPAPGDWMAPDERAPTPAPWQPAAAPPAAVRVNPNAQPHPMAIASFIAGLLALLFGVVCTMPIPGILAVIFGLVALSQFRSTPQRPGKGLAIAGIIMGGLSLAWFVLWLLWFILAIAFG